VDGLTEILKALTALYVAVGFWGTLVFLLAVIGALFSWSRLEDRELKELHRDLVNEKEKQIQRLAEDNRMWRNFFLKHGLAEEEVHKLQGTEGGPKPLSLPEPKTEAKMKGRRKK